MGTSPAWGQGQQPSRSRLCARAQNMLNRARRFYAREVQEPNTSPRQNQMFVSRAAEGVQEGICGCTTMFQSLQYCKRTQGRQHGGEERDEHGRGACGQGENLTLREVKFWFCPFFRFVEISFSFRSSPYGGFVHSRILFFSGSPPSPPPLRVGDVVPKKIRQKTETEH